MELLKNKVAIITGGSRGIGRAIAHAFAAQGASLVIGALHDDRLESTGQELLAQGAVVELHGGDIADPAMSLALSARALDRFGRMDILVNCAGIVTRAPMESLSHEDWHRVIHVNLHGAFYLCQAVLPHMMKQRSGKIINITSQMAWMPHPGASPSYEVSKAGLSALTRHMAYHYAKYSICVNAIAPGSIDTDLPKSMTVEARERLKAAIPLLRLGEPEEVGALAVFLASDQSNYITGATIKITGGSLMD